MKIPELLSTLVPSLNFSIADVYACDAFWYVRRVNDVCATGSLPSAARAFGRVDAKNTVGVFYIL